MLDEPDDLAQILDATMLTGRDVSRAVLPHGAGTALVVACSNDEVHDAWAAARSVVAVTGRWPVATASWVSDVIDAEHFERYNSFGEASATDILAAVAEVSPSESIDYFMNRHDQPDIYERSYGPQTNLQLSLAYMQRTTGSSPSEDEVRAGLPAPANDIDLERFLLSWELANDVTPPTDPDHMTWYSSEYEPYAIVFLPSPQPADTVAHLSFEDTSRPGEAAALGGVLRSWKERFGAELAAHYGTMLGFVVERPPTDIDTAFQLACEHNAVARCTFALTGVQIRDHARALMDRNDWFLHEQP